MENSIILGAKRIGIFRALVLGDFIFSLPALAAIRKSYPDAEIIYFGRTWHLNFLPGRFDTIDRVVEVPPARGEFVASGLVIDPDLQENFQKSMRAEQFDIVFQMHGGGKYSNPFVNQLGAKVTIGLRAEGVDPLDRWIPYTYYQNEVIRLLNVAKLAGAHLPSTMLQQTCPVLSSDIDAITQVLGKSQMNSFAVIHPGSTDPHRCWSPVLFAQVADQIVEKYGFDIYLTGSIYEKDRLSAIQGMMRHEAVNLCGRLALPALVGLLSKANLVIGNDTGPTHLAYTLDIPTIGLFWVENLINSIPLYRKNFYALYAWDRRCPLCGKYLDKVELDNKKAYPCRHEVSLMNSISLKEVIQAVEYLLTGS